MPSIARFALLVAVRAAPVGAQAAPLLPADATPPVLRPEVPKGTGTLVAEKARPAGARTADGLRDDWRGRLPGFGRVLVHSTATSSTRTTSGTPAAPTAARTPSGSP